VRGRGDGIVGRERELAALRAWLEAARGGAGRLVLCAGEPGDRQDPPRPGTGRGRPGRRHRRRPGTLRPDRGRPRLLAVAPGAPLARYRSRQRARRPGRVARGPVPGLRRRDQAVVAVAARRGLVVVLDDIHWGRAVAAGPAAPRRPAGGARLLVPAAFRDLEPDSVLPRVLPDPRRSPAAERVDLRGFDLAEVRGQLARMAADEAPADTRAVLDVTGGNPLFVREVARAMADGSWRLEGTRRPAGALCRDQRRPGADHRPVGVQGPRRPLLRRDAPAVAGQGARPRAGGAPETVGFEVTDAYLREPVA
jgi:hypothetical protein